MYLLDELLKRLGSEYTDGYGPSPIPSPIDDEVSDLLTSLATASPDKSDTILPQLTERHGLVLLAFAERMASRIVREKQPAMVEEALSALAVAMKLIYVKEALPTVSLLYRSIQKLGLDPQRLFASASRFANVNLDEYLGEFMRRSEDDRSIEAMGYVEGEDAGGFRYIRTW